MDEVFGSENFIAIITYKTATNQNSLRIQKLYDYILWYGKTKSIKFKNLYRDRTEDEINNIFNNFDEKKNKRYKLMQIDDYDDEAINNLKKHKRLSENGNYGIRYEDDFIMTEYDKRMDRNNYIYIFKREKICCSNFN